MSVRNLFILSICQMISATGSIVMVTLGGIISVRIASDPSYATLPVSLMVLGVAVMTVPAALLMRRIGRKRGFAIASTTAALAFALAALAVTLSSFALFASAACLLGINMAFTQHYRFAATESVEPQFAARAISTVLIGAIGGALLGPAIVSHDRLWSRGEPLVGSLLLVAMLFVVQLFLLLWLSAMRGEDQGTAPATARPMRVVTRSPVFVVAALCGASAYAVMSFVMTATPISMYVVDGFSLEDTSSITRSHVLAMYVPSLVSGYLIDRFGIVAVMFSGGAALLSALLVGWYDHTYMHYWGALVLLGVGWNFMYVGATTMLTLTYRMSERFRAQAVNEFIVFGLAGAASLLAGVIMHQFGWRAVATSPIPVIALAMICLMLIYRHPVLAARRKRQEELMST